MKRRLKEPFGKAGLTVAVIALVFAMLGGAYAASGLNRKEKKEVKNIAKKFAGKPGAPGAQGPQGAAGANGKDGAAGANGKDGTSGTNGANGKSVISTPITTAGLEGKCVDVGGTRLQVEGSTTKEYVCNGANGTTGFTKTLPSGETETGAWSYGIVDHSEIQRVSISFNIPLTTAPVFHVIKANGLEKVFNPESEEFEDKPQPACPGTVAEPAADPGVLCVYTSTAFGGETNVFWAGHPGFTTTYTTGAVIGVLLTPATTESSSFGTWAVTAP